VLSLASSRDSSSGADWKDVAGNIVAFEAINDVQLEIRVGSTTHRGKADLQVAVIAHSREISIGEAPSLASASVTCSGTRLKSLEGVLIHALYLLDAQLASLEIRSAESK
jgi:hypothetical protein